MSNQTHIDQYLGQMSTVLKQLPREDIDAAIELLFDTWKSGGTIFIAGNGGSSSTASHFACDLAKWTISAGKPRFKVLALTDNMPLFSALMNDEGSASVYAQQLEPFVASGDVLILISVHGGSGAGNAGSWSQNLLRALQVARDKGARVLGLSGFDGGALGEMADVCITVPVDSTPQVESFHLALEHLLCDCLRQKIADA
ncbi:MAG TPA: sedoheptulose 7-phosphate isomerase [Candidatus Latescibacteria bacterium]|jgi:D-sedoheptulose 7-phosphate isomerase|nr:sedoheptulose 7-phosphate isomerase [Candidatus Latescibacterota bacterium]|tara:strand:- start:1864 stop:2463 length:600 start_codon:yes stop_codon:yes gene_type:complete